MKKLMLSLSLSAIFFLADASAVDAKGKGIFEAKGCALCHKKDIDTIGPSLATIARAYAGKESSLVTYLQGQGTPIVDPARASVMNPQLVKVRTLFEEDIQSLARYIISGNGSPF